MLPWEACMPDNIDISMVNLNIVEKRREFNIGLIIGLSIRRNC